MTHFGIMACKIQSRLWVKMRKTHAEHKRSALTPIADVSTDTDFRRDGQAEITLQFLSQGYTVTVSRRSTKRRNAVGHGFTLLVSQNQRTC